MSPTGCHLNIPSSGIQDFSPLRFRLCWLCQPWNAHLPFPSSAFPKCPPLSRLNSGTNSTIQVLSRPQKNSAPPLSSCCTYPLQLSLLCLHSVISGHHLTFSTISLWQLSEQRQVWRLGPYGYSLFVKEMRTAIITFFIQSLFKKQLQ